MRREETAGSIAAGPSCPPDLSGRARRAAGPDPFSHPPRASGSMRRPGGGGGWASMGRREAVRLRRRPASRPAGLDAPVETHITGIMVREAPRPSPFMPSGPQRRCVGGGSDQEEWCDGCSLDVVPKEECEPSARRESRLLVDSIPFQANRYRPCGLALSAPRDHAREVHAGGPEGDLRKQAGRRLTPRAGSPPGGPRDHREAGPHTP